MAEQDAARSQQISGDLSRRRVPAWEALAGSAAMTAEAALEELVMQLVPDTLGAPCRAGPSA